MCFVGDAWLPDLSPFLVTEWVQSCDAHAVMAQLPLNSFCCFCFCTAQFLCTLQAKQIVSRILLCAHEPDQVRILLC